jgi:hypothetical protein
MNEILTCLEQKVILLTEILNLTKQIEVRSKEPDTELDDFLNRRGIYISRVNKCDHLILSLSQTLPAQQQERIRKILHDELSEQECSEEELVLLQLSNNCTALLQRAAVIDQSARDAIQAQCDDLREKINQARKNGNQSSMYNNIN